MKRKGALTTVDATQNNRSAAELAPRPPLNRPNGRSNRRAVFRNAASRLNAYGRARDPQRGAPSRTNVRFAVSLRRNAVYKTP